MKVRNVGAAMEGIIMCVVYGTCQAVSDNPI